MKKITFLLFFSSFAATSIGQQTNQKQNVTKTDYQAKSKKQKKTALIFLAGGTGLIATSFIIPKGEKQYDGICIGALCDDKYKNDGIKSAFFIAGAVSALGSIPFFISSSKNRKRAKAISVSFKKDNASFVNFYNKVNISYPAISLKIGLN